MAVALFGPMPLPMISVGVHDRSEPDIFEPDDFQHVLKVKMFWMAVALFWAHAPPHD